MAKAPLSKPDRRPAMLPDTGLNILPGVFEGRQKARKMQDIITQIPMPNLKNLGGMSISTRAPMGVPIKLSKSSGTRGLKQFLSQ